MTDSATRASRFVFLALSEASPVQTRIRSPSRSTHPGATCGEPSGISVARWDALEGDRILVCTGEASLKAKNTKRDARVALSVIAMDNPYKEAQLRGRVVERRPDADFETIDRVAQKYARRPFPFRQNPAERVVLVIEVERARYAVLPFTHTPA